MRVPPEKKHWPDLNHWQTLSGVHFAKGGNQSDKVIGDRHWLQWVDVTLTDMV